MYARKLYNKHNVYNLYNNKYYLYNNKYYLYN